MSSVWTGEPPGLLIEIAHAAGRSSLRNARCSHFSTRSKLRLLLAAAGERPAGGDKIPLILTTVMRGSDIPLRPMTHHRAILDIVDIVALQENMRVEDLCLDVILFLKTFII